MSQDTGFAHFVIEDNYNKQFLLLGSQFLEDDLEGASPVLLETMDGQPVSVSRENLNSNYRLLSNIRIAKCWTGASHFLAPVSPVFISYKGLKVALIGVTHRAGLPDSRRYAVYQRISEQDDAKDVFSMPLDEFYDMFSLLTEASVTMSPYEIDENGTIGYITNRNSIDKQKFPVMDVAIEDEDKSMLIRKISN